MNTQTSGTDLGARVRRYREDREFTLSDLARLSGVSRSYLYQVESGESSPTEEKLQALAHALGVTLPDLLGINSETIDIPPSLKQFAQNKGLTDDVVNMLAKISYRGSQPDTVEKWELILLAIQTSTAHQEH
jgi:transcriptional regulator with XRE-family HTH domain